MVEYLKTVFSNVGEFDPAAVEVVPQRRVQPHSDMAPTVHEIRKAVKAMGNGKSGGDAKLPAEYWKALLSFHFWNLELYQRRKSGHLPNLLDVLSENCNLPAPHAHCVEQNFYVSFLAVDISC